MAGAIARVGTIYYLCSMAPLLATPARVVCYLCKESLLSLQGEYAIVAGRVCEETMKNSCRTSEKLDDEQ